MLFGEVGLRVCVRVACGCVRVAVRVRWDRRFVGLSSKVQLSPSPSPSPATYQPRQSPNDFTQVRYREENVNTRDDLLGVVV